MHRVCSNFEPWIPPEIQFGYITKFRKLTWEDLGQSSMLIYDYRFIWDNLNHTLKLSNFNTLLLSNLSIRVYVTNTTLMYTFYLLQATFFEPTLKLILNPTGSRREEIFFSYRTQDNTKEKYCSLEIQLLYNFNLHLLIWFFTLITNEDENDSFVSHSGYSSLKRHK